MPSYTLPIPTADDRAQLASLLYEASKSRHLNANATVACAAWMQAVGSLQPVPELAPEADPDA